MALRCENFKGILTTVHENQRWIAQARCKQWPCAYCAQQNAKIWQARIIQHINTHNLNWSWFTLTAHSKKRTASASLKNLREAWDKLRKRIRRHFPDIEKIHYVRVYERHQSGAYHLHCIISVLWDDIKQRTQKNGKVVSYSAWLAKTAKELKIGYYTHAANFTDKHAGYIAGYVAKYMTKQIDPAESRVRMIQASQGWTNEKPQSEYNWQVWNNYGERDYNVDLHHKRTVIDLNEKKELSYDDFLIVDYYPVVF